MAELNDENWQLRLVRVPRGTHLSDSKKSPGRESNLLREDGSNRLLGPTESIPVDLDEILGTSIDQPEYEARLEQQLTPRQQVAADAIKHVIGVVFEEVVVPVVRDFVAPALRQKLAQMVETRRDKKAVRSQQAAAEAFVAPEAEQEKCDGTVEDSSDVRDQPIPMGSAEFRERLLEALAAERYAAMQRNFLAHVVIEDEDLEPELARAIQLVMGGTHVALDEQALTALAAFLQGAPLEDDVPILDAWHSNAHV